MMQYVYQDSMLPQKRAFFDTWLDAALYTGSRLGGKVHRVEVEEHENGVREEVFRRRTVLNHSEAEAVRAGYRRAALLGKVLG